MNDISRFFKRLRKSIKKRTSGRNQIPDPKSSTSILPEWAVEELRELADIEPSLFPDTQFLKQFSRYRLPFATAPGIAYAECLREVDINRTDLVILVPWLTRGGADLGVLHHIDAAIATGKNVLVIATLEADSIWKNRLPPEVQFLEFGKRSHKLGHEEKLAVLIRILLQSTAKSIHIINSELGWQALKTYGKSLIDEQRKVYVSAYCDDYDHNNVRWSYPSFFMADCYRYLSGIICDSAWYPKDLQRQFGIADDAIHTVHFPTKLPEAATYRSSPSKNVLWAGRLTKQKRPDLLIETAKILQNVSFKVHGYTYSKRDKHYVKDLKKLPNVELHGHYDSFESLIVSSDISLFFYTSAWDGLPNVLLEAVAHGLPVVASAVCGVPEFIHEETGYPVFDISNPEAYASRILEALQNDDERQRKWLQAVKLLETRHSQQAFREEMQRIEGYFH